MTKKPHSPTPPPNSLLSTNYSFLELHDTIHIGTFILLYFRLTGQSWPAVIVKNTNFTVNVSVLYPF